MLYVHVNPKLLTRLGWLLHLSSLAAFIGFVFCVALKVPTPLIVACFSLFIAITLLIKFLDYYGYAVHRRDPELNVASAEEQ